MAEKDLQDVVAELDVVATWFAPGSARHRKITDLADLVAEKAGGRRKPTEGDPSQPTPGPGVRSTPVEVDSVGDIAEKTPAPKPPLGQLGSTPGV